MADHPETISKYRASTQGMWCLRADIKSEQGAISSVEHND
jgi:hypothetical protein